MRALLRSVHFSHYHISLMFSCPPLHMTKIPAPSPHPLSYLPTPPPHLFPQVKEAESITKNTLESSHREMSHAAEMAESREKALTSELQLASQSLQQAKINQQQLENSLNKSQRSLEHLQLSFQAEEVLYNEKILDAVHEVKTVVG